MEINNVYLRTCNRSNRLRKRIRLSYWLKYEKSLKNLILVFLILNSYKRTTIVYSTLLIVVVEKEG